MPRVKTRVQAHFSAPLSSRRRAVGTLYYKKSETVTSGQITIAIKSYAGIGYNTLDPYVCLL